jgi:hypothetical protein
MRRIVFALVAAGMLNWASPIAWAAGPSPLNCRVAVVFPQTGRGELVNFQTVPPGSYRFSVLPAEVATFYRVDGERAYFFRHSNHRATIMLELWDPLLMWSPYYSELGSCPQ